MSSEISMETDDAVPNSTAGRGRVVFVGAGPGDPELLTLAAVAALSDADVIMCDTEAMQDLLDHPAVTVSPNVLIASITTLAAGHSVTPVERADFVLQAAEGGRRVVRLVGGDPFLDGGVAGEAAACVQGGLEFEIIPGVSSLTAVPEYAGVALTDPGGVQFLPHDDGDFGDDESRHWATVGTLVVSTRAGHVASLVEKALAAGRPTIDPVLVTFRGGSTSQQSVTTTLGELQFAVGPTDPETRLHVIVGSAIASLRSELDWFESKPLFGWRVLVPRTKDMVSPMTARLRGYGARFDEVPTISVERPRTPHQMDRAVRGLVEGRYEWVAFTSVNAVKAVREKFEECGLDARAFSGLKVAAASQVTASALQAWGIEPDLVPVGDQTAAGLAEEFPFYDEVLDPINRIFLPRADIATETLSTALTQLGWEVEDVTAYRTVRAAPPPADTREAIKSGQFDAVVFSSSSTVRNLVGIAGKPHATTIVAVIGPATAQTCEEHGLRVDVMAASPSGVDLADALAEFASRRRQHLAAAGEPITRPSQRRSGRRRS